MRRHVIAALALILWGAGLTAAAVAQQPVKLGVLNDQTPVTRQRWRIAISGRFKPR